MTRVVGILLRAVVPEVMASFYAQVLGFRLRALQDGSFEGARGGLRLRVVPGRPQTTALRAVGLTIRVPSLVRALEPLRGSPLLREQWEAPEGRFAMVFDPEGNELCLFEVPPNLRRKRPEETR